MKRILLAGALVVLAVGAALGTSLILSPAPLVEHLIRQTISNRASTALVTDKRFELIFVGTGSPNRTPSRGQPCLAVVAGGRLFLFDAGEGSIGALTQFGVPLPKLDTIFLTHLHSDHMSGLGEVLHNTWLYGRTHHVDVLGPPGTDAVLDGFAQVYDLDTHERQRVLGVEEIDPGLAMGNARNIMAPDTGTDVVYDHHGVQVEVFRVDHPDWPDAYGYRVAFGEKTVVISGDTRKTGSLIQVSEGVDVLVHEALNMRAMQTVAGALSQHDIGVPGDRMDRIAAAHTTTLEVAEIARDAKVQHLVLTHLIPALPANLLTDRYFTDGIKDVYDGELTVARDGMRIVLSP